MSQPTEPTTIPNNVVLAEWTLGVAMTVASAIRTGLLDALLRAPATAAELAAQLGLDDRATLLVLELLKTQQLARREGDRYSPGPALLARANRPGGAQLELGLWGHLETFLRTGKPFVAMDQAPAERERIYRTLTADLGKLFEPHARALAERLPVQPRNVLDVGCGSGVWGLAMAERSSETRVTGLDLPAVLETFDARATQLGVAGRTSRIAGDMHDVAIPEAAFDLAIIANVVRLETPERAASLVARIARTVAPGGHLVVVDALGDGTPEGAAALATYALHLGLRTQTGRVHSATTITEWLVHPGLTDVRAIHIPGGAGALGALIATKPMTT
jgi:ubiquinone/menaquinone biosynthesis C-methylase UbiE